MNTHNVPPSGEPRPLPPARHRVRPIPPAAPLPAPPAPPQPDAARPDYDVGYGKPPKRTQFQPGQSGNPRGRPRGAKGLNMIVRETMTQKVSVRTAAGERRMSRMEAVMHKTLELAMKGNGRALAQLVALYSTAVPDQAAPASVAQDTEDLSATDLAMLEALRQSWGMPGAPASVSPPLRAEEQCPDRQPDRGPDDQAPDPVPPRSAPGDEPWDNDWDRRLV